MKYTTKVLIALVSLFSFTCAVFSLEYYPSGLREKLPELGERLRKYYRDTESIDPTKWEPAKTGPLLNQEWLDRHSRKPGRLPSPLPRMAR